MRFRSGLLVFFLFVQFSLFALPVNIIGKSSAGDAYIFRVYIQNDPISGREELAHQARPDKNGNFNLNFKINDIQKVSIKVGLQSLEFYAQPGETYHLNFNDIEIEDQNIFLPQSPLRVVFEKEDMLNLVIDGFDFAYTNFLQNQFIELIKYRDKRIYNLFEKSVLGKLEETPLEDSTQKEFFKNYIEYRLADIRLSARLCERDSIGLMMIDKGDIKLYNPAYSQFFMKFFDKYFLEYNKGDLYGELQNMINSGSGLKTILDKMGEDPVLRREQIRELVFIYSLKQNYFKRQFSKENMNHMLLKFSKESKFELNRQVSLNLYHSLTSFSTGFSIPEFSLKDQNGQVKRSLDYLGKFTYLMFVSPDCETCESDIRILKSLESQYTEFMQIVSIYVGYDEGSAISWMKKQNANWDFLWFNNDFGLLNEYRAKNFPKYIVVDREGKLLYYFPPKPREDFLGMLKVIKESEKEVKRESSDFFRKN